MAKTPPRVSVYPSFSFSDSGRDSDLKEFLDARDTVNERLDKNRGVDTNPNKKTRKRKGSKK